MPYSLRNLLPRATLRLRNSRAHQALRRWFPSLFDRAPRSAAFGLFERVDTRILQSGTVVQQLYLTPRAQAMLTSRARQIPGAARQP